jgi:hypothetical protein
VSFCSGAVFGVFVPNLSGFDLFLFRDWCPGLTRVSLFMGLGCALCCSLGVCVFLLADGYAASWQDMSFCSLA